MLEHCVVRRHISSNALRFPESPQNLPVCPGAVQRGAGQRAAPSNNSALPVAPNEFYDKA